jgi:hypothetical protein
MKAYITINDKKYPIELTEQQQFDLYKQVENKQFISLSSNGESPSITDDNENTISRVEVIGKDGREFVKILKNSVYRISKQDDGKTLKLFETPSIEEVREMAHNAGKIQLEKFVLEENDLLKGQIQTNSIEDLNELPLTSETQEKEDGNINMVGTCDDVSRNGSNSSLSKVETLSITDDNGKEYKFEKPEFVCEFLKIVEDDDGIQIKGYIVSAGQVLSIMWRAENGMAYTNYFRNDKYCLNPIKP